MTKAPGPRELARRAGGGANIDGNIQLLTGLCNRQKHTKHPVDFMQERGFLL